MKCFVCEAYLEYVKNKEAEKMGFVALDCPNGCEGGYLTPKNNPKLKNVKTKEE